MSTKEKQRVNNNDLECDIDPIQKHSEHLLYDVNALLIL